MLDFSAYITERTRDFVGREWVLRAADSWLQKKDGARAFLIIGLPGSGKTAIAARLCQLSQGVDGVKPPPDCPTLVKGLLSAAHFCRFQDGLWTDPQVFAMSLSAQLAEHIPSFDTHLVAQNSEGKTNVSVNQQIAQMTGGVARALTIESINLGAPSPEEVFNRLVRMPLEAAIRGGHKGPVVILVDGLDEPLTYGGAGGIAHLITHMANAPSSIRLILTSSPGPAVEGLLRRPEIETLWLTGESTLPQTFADIERYVEQWLEAHPKIIERFAPDRSRKQFVAAVQSKSDGNLLYVCELLEMLRKHAPEERIGASCLAALPDGLAGFYALQLSAQAEPDGGLKGAHASVLGTLSVAAEALSEAQVGMFTGQGEASVRAALDALRPFLRVDDSVPRTERTYALHHSFAAFLMNADVAGRFWCAPREQHQRIVDYYRGDGWEHVPWPRCDRYGLKYLVGHLRSLLDHARDWREEGAVSRSLYSLVLSPAFREAQRATLKEELPPGVTQEQFLAEIRQAMLNALLSFLTGSGGVARTAMGMALVKTPSRVTWDHEGVQQANATVVTFIRSPVLDVASQDLRATADTALARGDWSAGLGCMRAHLTLNRLEARTQEIFRAIDASDPGEALRLAAAYRTATGQAARWARPLVLYVMWEAAIAGQAEIARQAAASATGAPQAANDHLCHGILIRAAQALAARSADHVSVEATLAHWGWPEAKAFLPHMDAGQPLTPDQVAQVRQSMASFERGLGELTQEGEDTFISATVDLWMQIWWQYPGLFPAAAADPVCRAIAERLWQTVLAAPEPSYREGALIPLAVSSLFAPDPETTRRCLRGVLAHLLDGAEPAFDFDLLALMLTEARRRGLPAPELEAWFERARASEDPWGTALRAHSALAAALLRQGRTADALRELVGACATSPGCAPYAAAHFLSLANRWWEAGCPDLSLGVPGGQEGDLLRDAALVRAYRARDADMRRSHVALVDAHRDWSAGDAPDLETVRARLPAFADSRTATVYMDFVVARWSRLPELNRPESWRALVLLALSTQVSPHPAMMRLLASFVHDLTGPQVSELIRALSASLPELPTLTSPAAYAPLEAPDRLRSHFCLLGDAARQRRDFTAATRLWGRALELCRGARDRQGEARALLNLGRVDEADGRYERASGHYEQSAQVYKDLADERGQGRGAWGMGRAAASQYHYDEAMAHYREGHALLARAGEPPDLADAVHGLGTLAERHGDHDVARSFYKHSVAMYEQQNNPKRVGVGLNQLGRIAEEQKKYAEARDLYLRSLALVQTASAEAEIATVLYNLGHVAELEGDLGEAMRRYQDSLALDERLKNADMARHTRGRLEELSQRVAREG